MACGDQNKALNLISNKNVPRKSERQPLKAAVVLKPSKRGSLKSGIGAEYKEKSTSLSGEKTCIIKLVDLDVAYIPVLGVYAVFDKLDG
ncbi:hypothetical protein QJS10_CPA06g02237 [Acorus calamus]|uniref:Uncharacterized protein n=1 Tax=Acorus calamus TaxID=4465 RepID=A0AAV9EJJ3_ACOCL|nr:hypothetical protein QJS10_CPA06g02237 [Acorus calamus]